MASFGANHPCFCPDGADTGVVVGKLVSANLTVNLASGELYADDALAEQVSEFSSGSIAMETDDMEDDKAAVVYGCAVENGEVTYNKGDSAPSGKLGYYKSLMRNKVKKFKAYLYPQARAALGNDNAQTKGNSITFGTTSTTFTIFADENGDWRKTKEFNTEAEAKACVDAYCNVGEAYVVDVSVQGAGTGEGVSKSHGMYVPAGEDFTLTITGTATKVYDNGTDVTSGITGGTYEIADIDANHTIAVIF